MTTDSLRAVPRHYREASLAMGATRWQTIWRVTLMIAFTNYDFQHLPPNKLLDWVGLTNFTNIRA